MELSQERLVNWLARFGLNEEQNHQPIQIHASGHAAGVEILEMIEKIQPEILVPVHIESPGAFQIPRGSIQKPFEGEKIRFSK